MKTVKKLTAIFLCFVMLLGVSITSASALEIGDTVEFVEEYWDGDSYTETWIYAGTAKEGINKVESEESDIDLCYEFNVEKSGYYSVTWLGNGYINARITETYEKGIAKNYADNINNNYENEFGIFYDSKIFYLEEGVSLINIYVNINDIMENSFKIEYFADSITDVKFEDEKLYAIKDNGMYSYDDYLGFSADYTIEFSNSITVDDEWVNCLLENELKKGENTVTMVLPGYEKEIFVNYYEVSDFIESVEIENLDKYLELKEFYDDYEYPQFDNEKITVSFKDGTKQTINYIQWDDIQITLPCGKVIYVLAYYPTEYSDIKKAEKPSFVVSIGDTRFIEKECNITKVSFSENLSNFSSDISHATRSLIFRLNLHKEIFMDNGNFAVLIQRSIEEIKLYGSFIFDDISTFIRYYL